jgi:ABC-type transport system involved in multi-copper enzyme maturation permease subunit
MSNEYSHRTLKQNLIDGLSKKEFVLSKFLTVLLFSVISTLFLVIVSLILGYSFSDFTELSIVFSDMEYVVGYFIKLLAFFTFCMFVGILIKRSAFALGFLFIWWIFEGILYGVLNFRLFRDSDIPENIMQFFPLTAMSNIVIEPFSRLTFIKTAANQIGEELDKDYGVHWYQLLIVIIWTVLFVYLSLALLKKRDL